MAIKLSGEGRNLTPPPPNPLTDRHQRQLKAYVSVIIGSQITNSGRHQQSTERGTGSHSDILSSCCLFIKVVNPQAWRR